MVFASDTDASVPCDAGSFEVEGASPRDAVIGSGPAQVQISSRRARLGPQCPTIQEHESMTTGDLK